MSKYALFLIATLSFTTNARTAEFDVPIGTVIANLEFKDIRYLPRSLTDLGKPDAYLFVFTRTTCPLVRRYLPRLNKLHSKYGQRVQFVAINVGPEDTIRDVASHAIEYEALFPFVKDMSGGCVRALGVSRTPEVVILDKDHTLVYRGRVNDQYRIGGTLPKPRRHDLEEAIKEILAGKKITVCQTVVDGCQITLPEKEKIPVGSVTFHRDVAPLMRQHCVTCHRPGTAAPFSLDNYRQVRSQGEMIAEVVGEGRMPPWFANPRHGTFQNDRSLTEKERDTIVAWVRSGMVEGDPVAEAVRDTQSSNLPPVGKWTIAKPDVVTRMLFSHNIPADGFVPYRYVALPYVFLRETWVEAFEIVPDNRTVVHHANLAYATPKIQPGPSTFITGYVPGGQAMDLTHFHNDVAFRIPALAVLGLQIHYITTGKPERCNISVGIRYKRGTVRKQLYFNLADPHFFQIPPHHPAYPISDSFTLKKDASILGLFAHMHLRGKDMTFFAHRPDGTTETLLEIPNYNFDWQIGYEIKPGKKQLPGGTRIEAIAHYDNSRFNPYNPDPEETIRYGVQTIDEMMNGYVFFTYDDEDLNLPVDPETGAVR